MTDRGPIKTKLIDKLNGYDLHETVDGQRSLYVTLPGKNEPRAGAWGPAADNNNWFAWRTGTDPIRVESRDTAVAYITAAEEAVG